MRREPFSALRAHALRFWSEGSLLLAPLLLCHRHRDGGTHTLLLHAAVKTAWQSDKAFELQVSLGLDNMRQPADWVSAERSNLELDWLFRRELQLKEGLTTADAASKPTPTPLRNPTRARAEKRLVHERVPEKCTTCFRVPTAMCLELRCVCRLIDLVSSSSWGATVSVLAHSDALRRPFFPSHPLL